MGAKLSKAEAGELAKNTSFSKNEIEDLFKEFKEMDTDHSGELDPQEFKALFKTHLKGTSDAQMQKLFQSFDSDGSGTISFQELALALSVVGKGSIQEKLEFLFNIYDADSSGTLTSDEIRVIVKEMKNVAVTLGRNEANAASFIEALISKLDPDKDGVISKADWIEIGAKTPSLLTLLAI